MRIKGLYAIVETELTPGIDPVALARQYLEAGVPIIQWRQKNDPRTKKLKEAGKIAVLKSKSDFIFIINDDPELAVEVGADGVHVGQDDRSVAEVRKIVGRRRLIGKSSHSLAEFQKTLAEDVDYLALGGIFPTRSKPSGHPVLGVAVLQKAVRISTKPVVAIGGINHGNIAAVFNTGVHAVAMITALTGAKDIVQEARSYVREWAACSV